MITTVLCSERKACQDEKKRLKLGKATFEVDDFEGFFFSIITLANIALCYMHGVHTLKMKTRKETILSIVKTPQQGRTAILAGRQVGNTESIIGGLLRS